MISGIAHRVIMRYLSEYVKNLDMKVELLSGHLSLKNVMLKERTFRDLLGLGPYGLQFVTCMATQLDVNVPLTRIRTEPIQIVCQDAFFSIASQFEYQIGSVSA